MIGNRQASISGKEWFSFRAANRYLVAGGSTHPNGKCYKTVRDIDPIPVPNWVCDWIELHTTAVKSKDSTAGQATVSDDFDFDDFCGHYDISGHWDGYWFITDDCPVAGYRHYQSTRTGFYYDGDSLGFHCFAGGCDGSEMSIGQVIGHLNAKKGGRYPGEIWEQDDSDLDGVVMVDDEDAISDDTPELTVTLPITDDYTVHIPDLIREQKESGELPMTEADFASQPSIADVAVTVEPVEGLEFPDAIAMYGRLAEIARKHDRLQLGWLYPSLLAVASALPIDDAASIRSNLYVANLGAIGMGKTVCQEVAIKSILLSSEETIARDAPGSHSGLLNQLSEDKPNPVLLFPDELRVVFNSCSILGSNLPQMLCTLWNADEVGSSVKKGRQKAFGKLSICGGIAISDAADFGRVFGAHSVSGLHDRFLFGYSSTKVIYRPLDVRPVVVECKPVTIRSWVWDAKDEWVGDDLNRGRLAENALRIALVTATVNGDREITQPCLEAAFRLMEWQQRLREVFRPGVAETKEAEAFEAVCAALRERYDYQKRNNEIQKGEQI